MNPESTELPRILLVEDDPVSQAFLSAAAEATPAIVDVAGSVREAIALASRRRYALWLVDANLPDGRGPGLLAQLRAGDPCAVALAHTADTHRAAADELIAAGFGEVLVKPLPAAAVQASIRRALARDAAGAPPRISTAGAKLPAWDDDAASRALGGSSEHVATLRGLFLKELPDVIARLDRATADGDAATLHAELHRLRASCGFVGAARLAAAARAVADAHDPAALAQVRAAAQDTLDQSAPLPG